MKTTGNRRTKKQDFLKKSAKKRRGLWLGLTAVLIAAAVLGFGRTAAAAQQGRLSESKQRYEKQEEAYVERARRVLEEAGLNKAGVMLEYRQEADKGRSYTLYVHHRRWEKLGAQEREQLERELAGCAFEEEDCVFSCSFSG